MLQNNKTPGESVESILVASNFFLWMAITGMNTADSYLPLILFFVTLVSLIIIVFTKVDNKVILQKITLFMFVNFFGMLLLLTSLDYGFQEDTEEVDQFIVFFYIQLFMIVMVGISLLIRKFRLKNEKSV